MTNGFGVHSCYWERHLREPRERHEHVWIAMELAITCQLD